MEGPQQIENPTEKLDRLFLEKMNFKIADVIEDSMLGRGIIDWIDGDRCEVIINSLGESFEYAMNFSGQVKDLRRLENICQKRRDRKL